MSIDFHHVQIAWSIFSASMMIGSLIRHWPATSQERFDGGIPVVIQVVEIALNILERVG